MKSNAMKLYGYKSNCNNYDASCDELLELSETSIECTREEFVQLYAFARSVYDGSHETCCQSDELVFEFQTFRQDREIPNVVVVIRSK